MNYYKRIQKSIDFIEDKLDCELTLAQVAAQAYCSVYHFHRIFQSIVGLSLKEYIRKRRLSRAVEEVIHSKAKIVDIALKYQYKTHESFSRAVAKMYGFTPKEFRENKFPFASFEKVNIFENIYKLNLSSTLIGPEILTRDQFDVIGYELRTTKENEKDFRDIGLKWDQFVLQQLGEKIPNKVRENTYLGYSCDFDEYLNYSYIVCAEVASRTEIPKGMKGRTIPASRYASFVLADSKPELLRDAWRYIYGLWIPTAGYTLVDQSDFDVLHFKPINPLQFEWPKYEMLIPIK